MESCYWKEFLAATARQLAPLQRPKRLTVRRWEITERNVVISFFLLRRLVEQNKVSMATRDHRVRVFAWPLRGKLPTLLNRHRVEELYDAAHERAQTKPLLYICNQLVHAYSLTLMVDETRNWDSVLAVSDYDRASCIWRIPVDEIIDLLRAASRDYPYDVHLTLNAQTRDYEVETN